MVAERPLPGSNISDSRFGNWQPDDTGFVGLVLATTGSGGIFGWAEIHIGSNYDRTLIAWGYNAMPFATADTPALPEPSSLVLLASGAAGLAAFAAFGPGGRKIESRPSGTLGRRRVMKSGHDMAGSGAACGAVCQSFGRLI
jgi:hypothetical protein